MCTELPAEKDFPAALKLKLELVDSRGNDIAWNNDELAVLRKYAKVKHGFTREVLVPASMRLNTLNYMIQKLYGWQNSHLHSFALPREVFNAVTDNGSIAQWQQLCGVLFRYPEEDEGDRYDGDDYDGTVSFKTWLRRKDTGAAYFFCFSDSYVKNQRLLVADAAMWKKLAAEGITSLEPLGYMTDFGQPYDSLVECLTLGEVLCTSDRVPDMAAWLAETAEEVTAMQKQILSPLDMQLAPLTDTLLYSYHYGDDWSVRVRCMEEYDGNDAEHPDAERLRNVVNAKMPVCLAAEGLCLLDDVGGVHGFVDMLRTLHGDDEVEAEEMRAWARGMGWTGRMSRPENML